MMRETCTKCHRTDDVTRLFAVCQRTDCPYKHLAFKSKQGATRAGKLARLRLLLSDMERDEKFSSRAQMAGSLLDEVEEMTETKTMTEKVYVSADLTHSEIVNLIKRAITDDPRVDLPARDAMRRNPDKIEVSFECKMSRERNPSGEWAVTARAKFEERTDGRENL
jgi:hypothetical protein